MWFSTATRKRCIYLHIWFQNVYLNMYISEWKTYMQDNDHHYIKEEKPYHVKWLKTSIWDMILLKEDTERCVCRKKNTLKFSCKTVLHYFLWFTSHAKSFLKWYPSLSWIFKLQNSLVFTPVSHRNFSVSQHKCKGKR